MLKLDNQYKTSGPRRFKHLPGRFILGILALPLIIVAAAVLCIWCFICLIIYLLLMVIDAGSLSFWKGPVDEGLAPDFAKRFWENPFLLGGNRCQ